VGGVGAPGSTDTGGSSWLLPPPQAPSAASAARVIVICTPLLNFFFKVNMIAPLVNADELILCRPGRSKV
jgi:hypothetical protein